MPTKEPPADDGTSMLREGIKKAKEQLAENRMPQGGQEEKRDTKRPRRGRPAGAKNKLKKLGDRSITE